MSEQTVQKWTFRQAVLNCLDVVFGLLLKIRPIRSILQRFLLAIGWLWAYQTFRRRNKVIILGREHLLRKTGVLYVSKHLTLIDSFLIGLAVVGFWEVVFFPSHVPWNAPDFKNYLSKPFFGRIFSLLKTIPVVRGSKSAGENRTMITRFCECVRKSALVLFPEGSRGPSDDLGPFVDGFASVIYHATRSLIVVPILLHDIQKIMPKDGGFTIKAIRRGLSGTVVIGPPINMPDLVGETTLTDDLRRRMNERVRQAILALRTRLDEVPV